MDINEMINNEVPNATEIQVAIEERNKINKWKKELEEELKHKQQRANAGY